MYQEAGLSWDDSQWMINISFKSIDFQLKSLLFNEEIRGGKCVAAFVCVCVRLNAICETRNGNYVPLLPRSSLRKCFFFGRNENQYFVFLFFFFKDFPFTLFFHNEWNYNSNSNNNNNRMDLMLVLYLWKSGKLF